VVRRVQGLSANSFAEGSGTSVGARRGNTTAVAATEETLELGAAEEFVLLPVASVTTQPRNCTRPPVQVPQEAIEAEYEGTLRMTLNLNEEGKVIGVVFLDHAEYGVEDACRAAAMAIRCKPARKDDVPVSVTGMPHRCTIKALD
jgi:outer membrane biosynthesis protein TonB